MKLQITIPIAIGNKLQIVTAVFFSSLCNFSFSQNQRDTKKYSFSLQQAIDFAMKNQTQVQNAAYDEQSAKMKVRETRGIGLPQVNGSVTANDFLEIPTTVIPAKAFNPFAPSDAYMAVKFGLPYSSSAGIDATQLVFNSDYLVGLQAAKTYLELSRKATQRTKIDVSVSVTKAYYSVLVNDERTKLVDANIARIKTLMETTKALNENGVAEKIDLDRITVTYNNLLVEKEKIQRLQQLGIALLKFQIGMDQMAALSLSDKLSDIKFAPEISSDKCDYGKRIEYSLLQTQKNVSQLNLKRNRMRYLPSAALFGSASANAYRTKFDFFDTKKGWYPTIIVGARINVGIFDGFQNHYRIQQSKIDLLKAENNLKMIQQGIDLEISSAKINLQNAAASLETQKKNIELAESVYKTTKIKYEQGVGSNLEVMTAQTSLTEAQTNYYNALYDALISKVDYDKATGTIK
ncbi:MAG: TolC family protein [Bacteroidetes bacterium]|nr:TolC family protein [Bacteroidota bacterium]